MSLPSQELFGLDGFPFTTGTPMKSLSDFVYNHYHRDPPESDKFFPSPGRNAYPDRYLHKIKSLRIKYLGLLFICIRDGDIIFVNGRKISQFIKEILPHIKTKFILITHDHLGVPKEAHLLQDPRLISWYCQNAGFVDPKMRPIPLGPRFYELEQKGIVTELLRIMM